MIGLIADTYANTIAGAVAPAFSLVSVAVAGVAVSRINRHRSRSDRELAKTRRETVEAVDRQGEAIRGDLRNGINDRLGALERGQAFMLAGQQEIKHRLDELEVDPPSHLG